MSFILESKTEKITRARHKSSDTKSDIGVQNNSGYQIFSLPIKSSKQQASRATQNQKYENYELPKNVSRKKVSQKITVQN